MLGTMISDFETMIADLDGHIPTEENRTRIEDTARPAYSTLAKRRPRGVRTCSSVAHMKLRLEVAKRELDEVAMQFRVSNRCRTARHHQQRPLAQHPKQAPPAASVQPSSGGIGA